MRAGTEAMVLVTGSRPTETGLGIGRMRADHTAAFDVQSFRFMSHWQWRYP